MRAKAMLQAEEERKRKERERQEEMRRQQELLRKQKAELEQERETRRRQEEEERLRLERLRQEEERKQTVVQKTEMSRKVEESNHMEELKRQEETRIMERKRLEQQIYQESKVVSGQVSKRSDDVHGLGWGNVTTGFVSKKKLGFLQKGGSVERDWSVEGSPGPRGQGRGLRVTFAESPGSRPESAHSIDRSQQLRAQTPPLAGEWAVQQGSSNEYATVFSISFSFGFFEFN